MIKIANAPCSWGVLEFDLEGEAVTNPTNRKLSEADIQEIRRAYAAGEGSLAVLGAMALAMAVWAAAAWHWWQGTPL